MLEILPGVHHWTAMRESIGALVSSYYVEAAGVLIDPMLPEEGLDAFAGLQRPQQVVLTSGLHARDAGAFADAFGCVIRAPREAASRLQGRLDTQPYGHGDELAPAVTGLQIGRLAPDEYALHLQIAEGAIVFADALNHYGDTLGFFPDHLLGDDPEAEKQRLREGFARLVEAVDFDHLLFAHGAPILGDGRERLKHFAAG